MWLVGVVVRRYRYIDILIIIINFPTPLVLGLFLAAASLLLCSFFKCFFGVVSIIFLQYISKRYSYIEHSRSFKKSRSREYKNNYLIISIIKERRTCVDGARAHESRDFYVRGTESGPNDV